MCGLVFMVMRDNSFKEQTRKQLFTELLYASALRGDDATGIYATSWDSEHEAIYKRALPSSDFVNTPGYLKMMENIDKFNVLMGHTRKATYDASAMKDAHAHPFAKRHIVMSHNGHLQNPYSLPRTQDPIVDLEQTHIDSDLFARAVADVGYATALRAASGAWALNWFDKEEQTFNISRNSDRPLYWGIVDDPEIIVGGSEINMLEWILSRNGMSFKKDQVFSVGAPQVNKKTGEWANMIKWTKGTFPKGEREQVLLSPPRPEPKWNPTGPLRIVDTSTGEILDPQSGTPNRPSGSNKKTSGPTITMVGEGGAAIKQAKIDKMLLELGLHRGMEMMIGIDSVAPYDKSQRVGVVASNNTLAAVMGRAFGIIRLETPITNGKTFVYYPCVMHGMDLTKIDMCKVYRGCVHGVTWDDVTEEHTIVMSNLIETDTYLSPLRTIAASLETSKNFRAKSADIQAILRSKINVVDINKGNPSAKKAHAPTGGTTRMH